MRGRPPAWNLFADVSGGVWTELLSFASKDRLVLPGTVRRAAGWPAGAALELLAVLDSDGSARILPMVPRGAGLVADVRDLIDGAPEPTRSDLLLDAMARYFRLAMEPSGRFVVPGPLDLHLAASARGIVRAVVLHGQLALWGEDAWHAAQARRLPRA